MRLLQITAALALCSTFSGKINVMAKSGTFLHVTDIHLDEHYLEKSDPATNCHRKDGDKSKNTAGHFGTLGSDCDSPVSLVDSVFDFMKGAAFQDVDFIVYTGDTARHDRDSKLKRTDSDILAAHKKVLSYFSKTFDMNKVTLLPTLGNNDMFDHNAMNVAESDKNSMNILEDLKQLWKPLDLNLTSDFSNGGYFVQNIANGPSVISLNSMYFFTSNTEVSDCDKAGSPGAEELVWLEGQLQEVQRSNKKAYLMSHVPPVDKSDILYKSKCYSQYVNLLGKYSEVIAAHLTGHTNDDNLAVLYKNGKDYSLTGLSKKVNIDFKTNDIVGVLTNAPSVLPQNNPGIRVYQYDQSDYTILGWDQYSTDLKKANKNNRITWQKEYSSGQVYGVQKLDASGWRSVVQKLKTSKKVFNKYKSFIKVEGI
ncbi:hypothetical protein K450DRAFT_4839 [Umbelopsis ramanniana AG]|uniref:Calcineurin-like phosphoesterase domain-containing protein n=1 Tax=Umbelopsis ramanniana AG TaxID=1314678 RepID=A0AAD5EJJ3_UMBRA|nr:uncharacterized protein K450DRAFT_4839 [Umbelopsis ramanniana AG]KAI8584784.1 hypothetical protein K450DRAFT_4839 [Umbelopsis ramanniana AG]